MNMNLEDRNNQILIELINNPQITSNVLYERFDLSRSQLNYALKKINDFLDDGKLPQIKRTKNGHFLVPSMVVSVFGGGKEKEHEKNEYYIFSGQERVWVIELMILAKNEYLSLDHFIVELGVSRNTVLRDLKRLDTELEKYDLKLNYNRQKGYFLQGDEWNKRDLLSSVLMNLAEIYDGVNCIIQFAKIDANLIESFKKRISLVEEKLNIQFTDDRLKVLPLLLILIIRRAKRGKHITYNFKINDFELADTKEFLAAEHIIWDVDEISRNERVYLTLLLLTTNLSQANILSVKEIDSLKEALLEVLNNFEKVSGLTVERKEKLLERLLIHMRPAYYRIKYHLNLQTRFYQENKDSDLFSLFYLVKESSSPLVAFFGVSIPDPELFLISLFIGSHIVESTEIIRDGNRRRAIIVCPNGISISLLLRNTLQNLLPEIDFIDLISERKFYQSNYEVDFIFSAIPLETKKSVFVVNNFLTEQEKRQLRERVLRSVTLSKNSSVSPEKIMSLVKKYTVISDEENLYHELLNLFTPKDFEVLGKKRLHLMDVLNHETIQIFEEEIEWQELLDNLAKPLEEQNTISKNFVDVLKKEMPILPQYTILRNTIGLPHTVSEAGALGVGISMGIAKKGVLTENGSKIYTVVLLASNDKDKHVDLIFELMNLAGSKQLEKIEKAKSTKEITNLLVDFSEEYWRN
ncbi:BglG family transcription antiterminator [Candidatus Enterococcus murrayae]|uniref:Ascorbate-specific PTS system EIIA component n=1 Tax=Candidatus Enterococcus murrayae TaxID=2815321 RepID=A0ABS3HF40_9ENTE|nr:BglG family transcription antiterminator [Enterococcus sp. MJM16]MBO0451188.1 BglG family transcription antiterminator [Enterococcus sp. MJM16]